MTSLKTELHNLIKSYYPNYCPIDILERKTKELGYKISNYERRLRKSESPTIKALKNGKGYIYGYLYQNDQQNETGRQISPILTPTKQNQLFKVRITY